MNSLYITQNMQQFSKFDFLLSRNDELNWYFKKKKDILDVSLDNLLSSSNKQYMIIAEPGYGKTRLLKEIIVQSGKSEKTIQAFFIDAKKIKQLSIVESLEKCKNEQLLNIQEEKLQKLKIFKNTNDNFNPVDNSIVCIDALDEVPVNILYELLEKIEEFIEKNKLTKVFLSCRTHHLKKVSFDFESLDFKFVALNSFSVNQIKYFLEKTLNKKIDLDAFYYKSKISNLLDFISIPRYLYYFSELLKEATLEEVVKLSRIKIFEHFIYRKINKELQKDTPQSQIDLLKRVLEKLALIMKIDGVSEITKDKLMTIFDKMDSNFSQIAFREDLIQKLYDRSLIKDNIDTIEFENQEFLDYLAAKELARFDKVEQVFFDIAMEPNILALYESWFYVLPFVFELRPSIIELFLDFLEKNSKKVFSPEYFQALLDMEPENLPQDLKSKIFDVIFEYYTNHKKWLNYANNLVAKKLSRYCDDKDKKIKDTVDGRKSSGTTLQIFRINAIELIANKLDEDNIKYWQNKATEWLKLDVKVHQFLHRSILNKFAELSNGDLEWIKKQRFIFEKGIKVQAEYARACYKVAPNDKFSIDVYLDTEKYWRQNKVDINLSRFNDEYDYILKIDSVEMMKYALEKIWKEETYQHRFCENIDNGVDKEYKIREFKKNLIIICDSKLLQCLKNIIKNSMYNNNHNKQKSIYTIFVEVILAKDKMYIKEYVKILEKSDLTKKWYYHQSFLDYISIDFVSKYFDKFENTISNIEDQKLCLNLVKQIYYRLNPESEIRKNIIKKYPKLIQLDTNEIAKIDKKQKNRICKEWTEKIEPEPKKFSNDLFDFYLYHKEELETCDKHKDNLKKTNEIAKKVLKNINPLAIGKIEKKERGGTTVCQVDYYRSCIKFIYDQDTELDQKMRDNVFRYLPFDINNDYEITLSVAKSPSKKAIQDIADVYAGKRDDDLGVYHVRQFVELYNTTKLSQLEPVLMEMLKNTNIEEYERLYIAQSLPANILTVDIIKENRKKLNNESGLSRGYLSLMIKKHGDHHSINEAFEWTKNRAENMKNYDKFYDSMASEENLISISMVHVDYPIERDKDMLLLSSKLSKKSQNGGSSFLKKLVENHLKYLIEINKNAHNIILEIENFLDTNKNKNELHLFEYTLQDLKQVYLNKVKEPNIANAIKKYNQLWKTDYLPISSSFELRELLNKIIEVDIKQWIEDEGAYKHIQELAKKYKNINAEDFIQKSIKSQIELALVKRGFRTTDYKITREEQLLDDKRLDFTVSYGFVGSIMIELKLSNNAEAKPTTKVGKSYPAKLKTYMSGANCDYGLFVILDIDKNYKNFNNQINELNILYKSVKNISIVGLNTHLKKRVKYLLLTKN